MCARPVKLCSGEFLFLIFQQKGSQAECFARFQGYLQYEYLKYFSKTFKLKLLPANYTVKDILFKSFYIADISQLSEYLRKCSQVNKSNHGQMLYKNR